MAKYIFEFKKQIMKEPQIQFLQRQCWYYCSKQDKKALSYTYTAPEDHYRHNGI